MRKTEQKLNRSLAKYELKLERVYKDYGPEIKRQSAIFVANGGDARNLVPDDFKAQRYEAERS